LSLDEWRDDLRLVTCFFDAEFYLADGNLSRFPTELELFHFNTFPLPMETSTRREFDDRNQEVERGAWIVLRSNELYLVLEKTNCCMSGFQVLFFIGSSHVQEVRPNLQADKAISNCGATRI
jgi:hypothetical protein